MEIFHIGSGDRKLVSVFYPANDLIERKTGIVICHPLGHEYTRFYQAVTALAKELSEQGYNTFKFDYYATGDSYGDDGALDVASARDDLSAVVEEMRQGVAIERVCVIGIRFGSLIAAISADDVRADSLVLWNPLFSGAAYLEEISANEDEIRKQTLVVPNKNYGFECFGYLYGDKFIADLNRFDLSLLKPATAKDILLLADREVFASRDVTAFDLFKNTQLTCSENTISQYWFKRFGEQSKSLVPTQEIRKIITWLEQIV
jgi:alpha/beta superfamily hydrolase